MNNVEGMASEETASEWVEENSNLVATWTD